MSKRRRTKKHPKSTRGSSGKNKNAWITHEFEAKPPETGEEGW